MRAGAKVMDGVDLDLSLRKIRKDGHRDGFDAPDGSLATAFDDASTFTSDILAAGVNLRWDTSDGRFTHILRASHLDSDRHRQRHVFLLPFQQRRRDAEVRLSRHLSVRDADDRRRAP